MVRAHSRAGATRMSNDRRHYWLSAAILPTAGHLAIVVKRALANRYSLRYTINTAQFRQGPRLRRISLEPVQGVLALGQGTDQQCRHRDRSPAGRLRSCGDTSSQLDLRDNGLRL
jgi:hypothetical protein